MLNKKIIFLFLIILIMCFFISCKDKEEKTEENSIELDTNMDNFGRLKSFSDKKPIIYTESKDVIDDYCDFKIRTFDKNSKPVWEYKWKDIENNLPIYYLFSKDYFVININKVIEVHDLYTGEFLWQIRVDNSNEFYIDKYDLYILGYGDYISKFNLKTGENTMNIKNNKYIKADKIVLDGDITVYNGKTLKSVSFDLDGKLIKRGFYSPEKIRKRKWDKVIVSDDSDASNIIDGNIKTFWHENKRGYGEKESIELSRNLPTLIRKLYIVNGNNSSEKAYKENAKISTISINLGDGKTINYTFDEFEYEGVTEINLIKPVVSDNMLFKIVDVKEGTIFKRTCISEIYTK